MDYQQAVELESPHRPYPWNWPIGVLTAETMYTAGRGAGAIFAELFGEMETGKEQRGWIYRGFELDKAEELRFDILYVLSRFGLLRPNVEG